MNILQQLRLQELPDLPKILRDIKKLHTIESKKLSSLDAVNNAFPLTANKQLIHFVLNDATNFEPLKVGVLFSGGQASGGHNVIIGLFDAMQKLNGDSRLYGFLNGPDGLIKGEYVELKQNLLKNYLNQGGFDLLGSSRTKIETFEHFELVAKNVKKLDLDGLVIIGGDDSNTNAAFLAEYFLQQNMKTRVVGVPKTIDGDLKNEYIEIPFGFDTASKTYSDIIANIARDALSAKKYYYFVKLMGRSASHITLECALQVHPNFTIIAEEVARNNQTLESLVFDICDLIVERAAQGKDYGVILIPEGLLEFIPEIKTLIIELNHILASDNINAQEIEAMVNKENICEFTKNFLSSESRKCFLSLTTDIQKQLLQIRDPHGNIQVSKIDTERFFIELVESELEKRKVKGFYKGKFSAQGIFCGYEGRSCFPSHFDSRYSYALGHVAALLIAHGLTGYMAAVTNLTKNCDDWQIAGVPLVSLMDMEERKGKLKPVIKKAFVDLNGPLFKSFAEKRDDWILLDDYAYPGPIQFYGPAELTDRLPYTLLHHNEIIHK
jgi:pyrophosphate--fructose-6-phosphate 1-phosphotransferase